MAAFQILVSGVFPMAVRTGVARKIVIRNLFTRLRHQKTISVNRAYLVLFHDKPVYRLMKNTNGDWLTSSDREAPGDLPVTETVKAIQMAIDRHETSKAGQY